MKCREIKLTPSPFFSCASILLRKGGCTARARAGQNSQQTKPSARAHSWRGVEGGVQGESALISSNAGTLERKETARYHPS